MIKTTPSDFRLQTSDFIYAEDYLKIIVSWLLNYFWSPAILYY